MKKMYHRKTPGHPRIHRSEIKDTQKCKQFQFNNEAANVILAPTSADEAWNALRDRCLWQERKEEC